MHTNKASSVHACLCMFVCAGTYVLKTPLGIPCIMATMGVEYIVIEKKV